MKTMCLVSQYMDLENTDTCVVRQTVKWQGMGAVLDLAGDLGMCTPLPLAWGYVAQNTVWSLFCAKYQLVQWYDLDVHLAVI